MQPSFLSSLKIRALTKKEVRGAGSKRQLFEVLEPFPYITKNGWKITVPKHFITDFASVPSITKCLIDDDDPDILYGSLIHDFIYSCKGHITIEDDKGNVHPTYISRKEADAILRETMVLIGAPYWKHMAAYRAVRLGGRSFWKE